MLDNFFKVIIFVSALIMGLGHVTEDGKEFLFLFILLISVWIVVEMKEDEL